MFSTSLTILEGLTNNEDFLRKSIPFIKEEYFGDLSEKVVFRFIKEYFTKYNRSPTPEVLNIEINDEDLSEGVHQECVEILERFSEKSKETDWLTDTAEKFCKDRAVYNAIMASIEIINGENKKLSRDGIPLLLSDALGVSFDTAIGHDYFNDTEERFDLYQKVEDRIPFDLEIFNKVTRGGLPKKTLSIGLAASGVGKTFFMCHHAAACMKKGYNVLYITMEMAEERIAERIDANLLNVPISSLEKMSKSSFVTQVSEIRKKTSGKLVIKEYPTAGAHAGHFKSLLAELKQKKKFTPDIIFIDYINICLSQRNVGTNANSYTIVKNIAEELRGLAVSENVALCTCTQTNRGGFSNSDIELTDTSDSMGTVMTADFMFALISSEELDQMSQLMVKILKNRFNDPSYYKRFVIGMERACMKFYDLEDDAQIDLADVGLKEHRKPTFDKAKVSKLKF